MSDSLDNLQRSLGASEADLEAAIDLVELSLEEKSLGLLFDIAANPDQAVEIRSKAIRAAQFIDRPQFDEILSRRSEELSDELQIVARRPTKDDYF